MRISDWSSDVCSSDLIAVIEQHFGFAREYFIEDAVHVFLEHQPCRHRSQGRLDHARAEGEIGEQQAFDGADRHAALPPREHGRASCRERGCQYVWISVVAVSLKNKQNKKSKIG